MYLGVALVRSRASVPAAGALAEPAEPDAPAPSWPRAFGLGFFTNATNPKATLFFMAIFTTLVQPTTPLKVQALYGLWMCCVNAGWFMLVAGLFTVRGVRETFLRMGHWLERVMGLVLLLFAARLMVQAVN